MSEPRRDLKPQRWQHHVEPDLEDNFGIAYRIRHHDAGNDPRLPLHLGSWLMYVPAAHPYWSWHALSGIALREAEGLPEPHKHFAEAAFELMVFALNPTLELPSPVAMPPSALGDLLMEPPDFVGQFPALPGGDKTASEVCELFVKACLRGDLVPDGDHRAAWREALAATVEHYQTGGTHQPAGQG